MTEDTVEYGAGTIKQKELLSPQGSELDRWRAAPRKTCKHSQLATCTPLRRLSKLKLMARHSLYTAFGRSDARTSQPFEDVAVELSLVGVGSRLADISTHSLLKWTLLHSLWHYA